MNWDYKTITQMEDQRIYIRPNRLPTTHSDFEFTQYKSADYCIGRVGHNYAGRELTMDIKRSNQSAHYLQCSVDVMSIIRTTLPELEAYGLYRSTSNPYVIRGDIIKAYQEKKNELNRTKQ